MKTTNAENKRERKRRLGNIYVYSTYMERELEKERQSFICQT